MIDQSKSPQRSCSKVELANFNQVKCPVLFTSHAACSHSPLKKVSVGFASLDDRIYCGIQQTKVINTHHGINGTKRNDTNKAHRKRQSNEAIKMTTTRSRDKREATNYRYEWRMERNAVTLNQRRRSKYMDEVVQWVDWNGAVRVRQIPWSVSKQTVLAPESRRSPPAQ